MRGALTTCNRFRQGVLCGRPGATRSERSGAWYCRACARHLGLPLPDAPKPKPSRAEVRTRALSVLDAAEARRSGSAGEPATDPDELTALRAQVEAFGVALTEIRDAARWQSRGLAWFETRAERALAGEDGAEVQP